LIKQSVTVNLEVISESDLSLTQKNVLKFEVLQAFSQVFIGSMHNGLCNLHAYSHNCKLRGISLHYSFSCSTVLLYSVIFV
jgi:hypothetical protein